MATKNSNFSNSSLKRCYCCCLFVCLFVGSFPLLMRQQFTVAGGHGGGGGGVGIQIHILAMPKGVVFE